MARRRAGESARARACAAAVQISRRRSGGRARAVAIPPRCPAWAWVRFGVFCVLFFMHIIMTWLAQQGNEKFMRCKCLCGNDL